MARLIVKQLTNNGQLGQCPLVTSQTATDHADAPATLDLQPPGRHKLDSREIQSLAQHGALLQ